MGFSFAACCCQAPEDTKVVEVPVASVFTQAEKLEKEEVDKAPPPKTVVEEPPAPAPTPVVEEKPPAPAPTLAVTPAPAAKEPQQKEFTVTVTKANKESQIGLELDTVGGVVGMVIGVTEGAVKTYNDNQSNSELKVQSGDIIYSVNGVKGDTKNMAQKAIHDLKLDLVFKRLAEWTVQLDKSGRAATLGMDLEYLAIGRSLLIQEMKAGLATDWNKANPSQAMQAGDRIVCVNSLRGTAEKMLQSCLSDTKLDLVVIRP